MFVYINGSTFADFLCAFVGKVRKRSEKLGNQVNYTTSILAVNTHPPFPVRMCTHPLITATLEVLSSNRIFALLTTGKPRSHWPDRLFADNAATFAKVQARKKCKHMKCGNLLRETFKFVWIPLFKSIFFFNHYFFYALRQYLQQSEGFKKSNLRIYFYWSDC